MASSVPIIRQLSWLTVLPQMAALLIAMAVAFLLGASSPALYGAAAYLAYSIGSRIVITRSHRAGVRLTRQQRFAEAIPKFQDSFEFFERHSWIDQFRSIVLMSPSAVSYREMALANIAFCYGQCGDGDRSRQYYRMCLERFPESGIAATPLRMLDSITTTAANSQLNS